MESLGNNMRISEKNLPNSFVPQKKMVMENIKNMHFEGKFHKNIH